jgi:hypothetical protein
VRQSTCQILGRRIGVAALGLVLAMLAVGCQARPVSRELGDYTPATSLRGLRLDPSQKPALVYKRPGAPGFDTYDKYIVGPITIDYRDPDMEEIPEETILKLKELFYNAIVTELREAGYTTGTKTTPDSMRMEFILSGFRASKGGSGLNAASKIAGSLVGMPMLVKVSTGEITIEGVFVDAYERRIDAVAVDRAAGARVFNGASISTWADVEGAFERWAKGIREAIDAAHATAAAE